MYFKWVGWESGVGQPWLIYGERKEAGGWLPWKPVSHGFQTDSDTYPNYLVGFSINHSVHIIFKPAGVLQTGQSSQLPGWSCMVKSVPSINLLSIKYKLEVS